MKGHFEPSTIPRAPLFTILFLNLCQNTDRHWQPLRGFKIRFRTGKNVETATKNPAPQIRKNNNSDIIRNRHYLTSERHI